MLFPMTINVEVEKHGNENTTSLVRRFTKRVRESGILTRVRRIRYHKRSPSKFLKKKGTLKALAKKEHYAELIKLGKIPEQRERYKRR